MHKNPIGARFIIASKNSSNKPISKAITKVFKLFYNQIENFNDKSRFYSSYNLFWITQNTTSITEMLDKINKQKEAKSIATYDFSTLFTNIRHDDLINQLNEIIELTFSGGKCRYIEFNKSGAVWTDKIKNKKGCYFTKDLLKRTIAHLIKEYYFKIGNITLLQTIGIPMGCSVSPLWANLYLHRLEYKYMIENIKKDKNKAKKFEHCKRYIDDLLSCNDDNIFEKENMNIYPSELILLKENAGTHATFLDLDISIVSGQFYYKLFDKRDKFPFRIVRMPYYNSDIPSNIFYSSINGEFLRICKATSEVKDLVNKCKELMRRMHKQGGKRVLMEKQLTKATTRHPEIFKKFCISTREMIKDIMEMDYR